MMAFAAWRRRTTLTAAPHDSPRRLLRVGDPCTLDRGESATAAAGRALINGGRGGWLGGSVGVGPVSCCAFSGQRGCARGWCALFGGRLLFSRRVGGEGGCGRDLGSAIPP